MCCHPCAHAPHARMGSTHARIYPCAQGTHACTHARMGATLCIHARMGENTLHPCAHSRFPSMDAYYVGRPMRVWVFCAKHPCAHGHLCKTPMCAWACGEFAMGARESLAPLGVPCLAVLAALLGSPMSEPPSAARSSPSTPAGRAYLCTVCPMRAWAAPMRAWVKRRVPVRAWVKQGVTVRAWVGSGNDHARMDVSVECLCAHGFELKFEFS